MVSGYLLTNTFGVSGLPLYSWDQGRVGIEAFVGVCAIRFALDFKGVIQLT